MKTTAVVALALALVWPPAPSEQTPTGASERIRLVAWAPENLPWKTERVLDEMRGVSATTVIGGVMWMSRSRVPGGPVIDDPPGDYAIPMEVAFVKPREYARYVAQSDREVIASLRSGIAVLPQAEVRLRNSRDRLVMTLDSHRIRTQGTVGNRSTQGHEVLMSRPAPSSFTRHYRFVLIRKSADVPRRRIRRRIESLLSGEHLRIRSETQASYLRYADQVHPQMVFKRNFGEFIALPSEEGSIAIRPAWVENHITTARVPILGSVRCHRKLFAQLRGALREVRNRGLAHTIRPDEYAGCFNSRYVATLPGTRISRHTWGIAVDVNVNGNAFGREPHQDPRLVRIMEKWGLAWGGRWPLPDGMHFEWARWP